MHPPHDSICNIHTLQSNPHRMPQRIVERYADPTARAYFGTAQAYYGSGTAQALHARGAPFHVSQPCFPYPPCHMQHTHPTIQPSPHATAHRRAVLRRPGRAGLRRTRRSSHTTSTAVRPPKRTDGRLHTRPASPRPHPQRVDSRKYTPKA